MIHDGIRTREGVASRPISALFRDLREEIATLFRQEVELARTEVSERIGSTAKDLGRLAMGGFVAYAGVLLLLVAVSILIGYALLSTFSAGIAYTLGFAIVGLVFAIIGYALIRTCLSNLSSRNLLPQQTVESLRDNKEWIKEKVS